MKKTALALFAVLMGFPGMLAFGQSGPISRILAPPGAGYRVSLDYEIGAAKVLFNTIQIGKNGTNFNYVTQGGEELLVPYSRYQAELTLASRNHLIFLYQPLLFKTQTRVPAGQSVTVDDVTFAGGTNLNLTYSFPFWRLSYLFDVVSEPRFVLGVGASLQLRNASIRFENADGSQFAVSQNLGPVPLLDLRARYDFPNGLFLQASADGFYASSAILNGANFSFEGSILDASLRSGVRLGEGVEAFVNLRFIGGTAKGNSQYAGSYWTDSRSTYTDNRLGTMELTLGATLR